MPITATITKRFDFEAAHQLHNHKAADGTPGKCSRLHGHSYELIISLTGPVILAPGASDEGFVMDYYYLGRFVKSQIVDKWDHQNLNDLLPFRTTAEFMSHYIYGTLRPQVSEIFELTVTLKETKNTSAIVGAIDFDWDFFDDLIKGRVQCPQTS